MEGLKNNNKLDRSIKEMENLKKVVWDEENKWLDQVKDRAHYFYNYNNEKLGEILSSQVNFYLNPHTQIWKIIY